MTKKTVNEYELTASETSGDEQILSALYLMKIVVNSKLKIKNSNRFEFALRVSGGTQTVGPRGGEFVL